MQNRATVIVRIHNSGKLMLDDAALLDTEGFQIVYVFPYPDPVMIFPASCTADTF